MAKLIKRPDADRALDPRGGHGADRGPDGEARSSEAHGDGEAGDEGHEPSPEEQDLAEARVDAASIRDDAHKEAEAILAAARAEAEGIVAAAKEDAKGQAEAIRAEGRAAGQQEGLEALMAQAVRAGRQVEALQTSFAPEIVTLSMAMTKRILGRELEFAPETVVAIVKQALAEKARQRREITLRLHPEDAVVVREHRAELTELLSRCKEIAIQEDPDVTRHGVVIETEAGIIDAQLDVQLGALERAMRQVEQEGAS